MGSEGETGVVEPHEQRRGRTLLELTRRDGEWTATQAGVGLEGTGETAALAAMD
jgi:stress response protein SCP2